MNAAEIQQKIVGFLVSATGQTSIEGDTELQESGIIDSLMMMDLLVFVETELGLRLEFEDITPDAFATPATISRLIESRIADQHR
ncbi:MAG: phosphopantetheine-binding protein [Schlesneria sp.]|jgi:acyl carrier protein